MDMLAAQTAALPAVEEFTHPDGQVTSFARYGSTSGPLIFYFHGLPSSRHECAFFDDAAKSLGLQLIAMDRPGIGRSSVQRGRLLLDWPPRVVELASHLNVTTFHVLGTSAGGIYALACAKALPPEQLKGTGVVAGVPPGVLGMDGMSFGQRVAIYAPRWAPRIGLKMYDWMIIPKAQDPDGTVFEAMVKEGFVGGSERDKELLKDDRTTRILVEACREHFRQGNAPLLDEWRIFVSNWGFDLMEIKAQNVNLWYGADDTLCPVVLARKMAAQIGDARLIEYPKTTHYSILVERPEEILRELLAR